MGDPERAQSEGVDCLALIVLGAAALYRLPRLAAADDEPPKGEKAAPLSKVNPTAHDTGPDAAGA